MTVRELKKKITILYLSKTVELRNGERGIRLTSIDKVFFKAHFTRRKNWNRLIKVIHKYYSFS